MNYKCPLDESLGSEFDLSFLTVLALRLIIEYFFVVLNAIFHNFFIFHFMFNMSKHSDDDNGGVDGAPNLTSSIGYS